ncbi:glutathione S-transferase [Polyplosphaeria fusca]|uniref:Glutathione S-transferase n=1 Tax=Polyplosphaeria fusca TaxID=682080 RepID=A0A9P4R343_9PLEO|nr:glutathione S-transferase [Polyplosphaeria fusca]
MSVSTIQLWGHWGAPNPWKVATVLEALSLPYSIHFLELSEAKNEEYLKLNPNGRLPTIQDPNTGLTLWESGAIIQYLVDHYDKDGKISYTTFPEKCFTQQWLAFQISGQGPYFGQATWFARFHVETLPSATERYINEIMRVVGVLEIALTRNGAGWLVGEKCTYADLAFVTWAAVGEGLLKEMGKYDGFEEKFPTYVDWMRRLGERGEVRAIKERMQKGREQHGLKYNISTLVNLDSTSAPYTHHTQLTNQALTR